MSALPPTITVLQAQITALQNNKFIDPTQKALQIKQLQAQIAATNTKYGNVSTKPLAGLSQATHTFQIQQAVTQSLGAKAATVMASPEFQNAKAAGASKATLDAILTKSGVYITTPEKLSLTNIAQSVPATSEDITNVNHLLSRLNVPNAHTGSDQVQDVSRFISQQNVLTPNKDAPSPAAGGAPINSGASLPPVFNPVSTESPPLTVPTIPNVDIGGTKKETSNLIPSLTIPRIPLIADFGDWLNSAFKTAVDPTLLGGLATVFIVLIGFAIFSGRGSKSIPKVALPKLTA